MLMGIPVQNYAVSMFGSVQRAARHMYLLGLFCPVMMMQFFPNDVYTGCDAYFILFLSSFLTALPSDPICINSIKKAPQSSFLC